MHPCSPFSCHPKRGVVVEIAKGDVSISQVTRVTSMAFAEADIQNVSIPSNNSFILFVFFMGCVLKELRFLIWNLFALKNILAD